MVSRRYAIPLGPRIATREVSRLVLSIPGMTIHIDCPWCAEETAFTINEADAELVCDGCSTRMDFAPDSTVTYEMLYASAA